MGKQPETLMSDKEGGLFTQDEVDFVAQTRLRHRASPTEAHFVDRFGRTLGVRLKSAMAL